MKRNPKHLTPTALPRATGSAPSSMPGVSAVQRGANGGRYGIVRVGPPIPVPERCVSFLRGALRRNLTHRPIASGFASGLTFDPMATDLGGHMMGVWSRDVSGGGLGWPRSHWSWS